MCPYLIREIHESVLKMAVLPMFRQGVCLKWTQVVQAGWCGLFWCNPFLLSVMWEQALLQLLLFPCPYCMQAESVCNHSHPKWWTNWASPFTSHSHPNKWSNHLEFYCFQHPPFHLLHKASNEVKHAGLQSINWRVPQWLSQRKAIDGAPYCVN